MPPLVIDIRSAEDSRDVVHRAVQALHEGRIVVFPTETVYVMAVSALNADAVKRLAAVKIGSPEQRTSPRDVNSPPPPPEERLFTLAVKSADDAFDYVPYISQLGLRMARRCWPGPITLVMPDNCNESSLCRLPKVTRNLVCPNNEVGIRVPGHQTILDTLRMLPGPVVMTSANRVGEPVSLTTEDAIKAFGDDIQLALDDGRSRFGQQASVVRVKDQLEVLRPGVVSEQTLRRLSAMMILLVCTGNTCRSPMAEGICRKILAEKIGCTPEQLQDRGVLVMSAGLTASMGGCAANEAVAALEPLGIDLRSHESQPVTEQLIRHADLIWTMTRSHRQAIVNNWPDAASRTALLSMDERDIADPIGGPLEYYRKCAEQIKNELTSRLSDLQI